MTDHCMIMASLKTAVILATGLLCGMCAATLVHAADTNALDVAAEYQRFGATVAEQIYLAEKHDVPAIDLSLVTPRGGLINLIYRHGSGGLRGWKLGTSAAGAGLTLGALGGVVYHNGERLGWWGGGGSHSDAGTAETHVDSDMTADTSGDGDGDRSVKQWIEVHLNIGGKAGKL